MTANLVVQPHGLDVISDMQKQKQPLQRILDSGDSVQGENDNHQKRRTQHMSEVISLLFVSFSVNFTGPRKMKIN
jgi:hypothetical protein